MPAVKQLEVVDPPGPGLLAPLLGRKSPANLMQPLFFIKAQAWEEKEVLDQEVLQTARKWISVRS